MGKSPKSSQLLHHHSTLSSKSLKTTIKPPKPSFQNHLSSCRKQLTSSVPLTLNLNAMEEEEQHRSENGIRVPLSQVVSDCVKRWFSDTLKEAKSGDINMQVLVGQMYYNGYGVSKDAQKVIILSSGFLFLLFNSFSFCQVTSLAVIDFVLCPYLPV